MVVCGHCGEKMFTASGSSGRRYYCRLRWQKRAGGGVAIPGSCPGGGWVSMHASTLDPAVWGDVREWLNKPENVSRLLAEWEQEERSAEKSVTSRVEAAEATIRTLRGKIDSLADTIAKTANKESRRTLQEKLDNYGGQVMAQERKREKLLAEAHDAVEHAREEREVREWVSVVASHAENFSRLEQVAALRVLGAQVTIWRADYQHPDAWPQRYKIKLSWTGFIGELVILPARDDITQSQRSSSTRAPVS